MENMAVSAAILFWAFCVSDVMNMISMYNKNVVMS